MAQTEWDRLAAERDELIARSERYADRGLGVHAEILRRGGDLPANLVSTPMIVDTDVGGDPDDAIALLVAAREVPQLALVVTSDETDGRRARFARLLLDQVGRSDVPVVAGRALGEARGFCVEPLIPPTVPPQRVDAVEAAHAVVAGAEGPVRWVGMGPISNLADLLAAHPGDAGRLALTQMGGAVNYRDPTRAEHNVRLDPAAAVAALAVLRRPYLVTSDVTFRPEIEVTRESPLYGLVAGLPATPWAVTLKAHLDLWYERFHPGTRQHDALTLSAAMLLPFVSFDLQEITFDGIGRMTAVPAAKLRPSERAVYVSVRADYPSFNRWLEQRLGAAAMIRGGGLGG